MSEHMSEPEIIDLLPEHAREVAQLHISGITGGFISSLGIDFGTSLYKAIACDGSSFGYVVKQDDKIIGFASFTTDIGSLYKTVIRKSGARFFLHLAGKAFSRRIMGKVLETLLYPSRTKKLDLPPAEFLSMVIAEEGRGKGLATKLVQKGFDKCASMGTDRIKILAAVQIGPINKLYEKFGFKVFTQIVNHGIVSNVYVVPTDHFQKKEAE
jgi:GNAT superfamily N-acetyltransferase